MTINRYDLEGEIFTKEDRKMFARLQVLTNLPSAITKSIISPDGVFRIVYHCDAGEAASYLSNRAAELEKNGRGKAENYRSLSSKITKAFFGKNEDQEAAS